MIQDRCFISVDIGGTKIGAGVFTFSGEALFRVEQVSSCGFIALSKNLVVLFQQLIAFIHSQELDVDSRIVMGSPGNFLEDGTVYSGSISHLESYEGEFEGVNLVALFNQCVPDRYSVLVMNDAAIQLAGGLFLLNMVPEGKLVGYIGPGTGLGGAFAFFDQGRLNYVSDGHISTVLVPFEGTLYPAESLLSGSALKRLTGFDSKQINDSLDLQHQYRSVLESFGVVLVDLIDVLIKGQPSFVSGVVPWSEEDCQQIKRCRTFLIGGGVGTRGFTSEVIFSVARQRLVEKGYDYIQLHVIPDSNLAGLVGAHFFL